MRLLDTDKFTGITEHVDIKNGRVHVKTSQNIDSVIDLNADNRNNAGTGWKGDMHHVARIPMVVVEQWRNELKISGAHDTNPMSANNKKFFIAKLNDYNYSRLRTKAGRI